jgi:predicted transcriptional regulator
MDHEHQWLAGFPRVVAHQREQAALTTSELADQIGVPAASVERWEDGTTLPTLPQFFRLAELFGWPIPRAIIEEGLACSADMETRPDGSRESLPLA